MTAMSNTANPALIRTRGGWVVRSRFLTPEHLIRAMEATGDFFQRREIERRALRCEGSQAGCRGRARLGASYRIELHRHTQERNSASALPTPEQTGIVVATVEGTEASYTLTGKELYVRALITSSLEPADPVWAKQKQQAWTQPVGFK